MEKSRQGTTRLEAIVHGRVQGVSYRHYTQRRARQLGLVGHVRNLWDGTVEVVAEGDRADLEQLLAFLHTGPQSAVVTNVDIRWALPSHKPTRFEVRF
jgi:acylphosphatase